MIDESKGICQKKLGGDKKTAGGTDAAGKSRKVPGKKTKPLSRKYDKYRNKNNHANNVTEGADNNEDETIIQCYVCYQRGDYKPKACPNGDEDITLTNCNF